MELDAIDGQGAGRTAITSPSSLVADTSSSVRDALCGKRVVAPGGEVLREPREDPLAVVVNRARLAVEQPLRLADLATKRRDDRLVA